MGEQDPKKPRRISIVPKQVLRMACASVVPVLVGAGAGCGKSNPLLDGDRAGASGQGSFAGSGPVALAIGGFGGNGPIALAVGGFGGNGPNVISLAIGGFGGNGPIALAIGGFGGNGGTVGPRFDAGSDASADDDASTGEDDWDSGA